MSDIATAEDVEKVRARLRSGYFRQDEATDESYRAIELLLSRIDAMQGGVSEWISVEDRLPDNYVSVLIWPQIEFYDRDEPIGFIDGEFNRWMVQTYDGYGLLDEPVSVTHWAPLPEPPT